MRFIRQSPTLQSPSFPFMTTSTAKGTETAYLILCISTSDLDAGKPQATVSATMQRAPRDTHKNIIQATGGYIRKASSLPRDPDQVVTFKVDAPNKPHACVQILESFWDESQADEALKKAIVRQIDERLCSGEETVDMRYTKREMYRGGHLEAYSPATKYNDKTWWAIIAVKV